MNRDVFTEEKVLTTLLESESSCALSFYLPEPINLPSFSFSFFFPLASLSCVSCHSQPKESWLIGEKQKRYSLDSERQCGDGGGGWWWCQ